MTIAEELFALQDKEYAAFQAKLTPGIEAERIIGVRVPRARELAKRLYREGDYHPFLNSLPHLYFDENILHALLISEIKDFDTCMVELEKFLPYIDNWAVCDILSPKVFQKRKGQLLTAIQGWVASPLAYTCRFGMEMLMTHFLDDAFLPEYLELPSRVRSQEYYVNMMTAWFFATALAKQWDSAITYLEQNRLDTWTHNKTIQKARESYRISADQKEYLKTLKRKG
ncbi:MAG: DNA alkylation repair protein [Oscillospiraceae bacterium]|nr:DNA alkylation repair protein [Oscillospiraceae bacterium]